MRQRRRWGYLLAGFFFVSDSGVLISNFLPFIFSNVFRCSSVSSSTAYLSAWALISLSFLRASVRLASSAPRMVR